MNNSDIAIYISLFSLIIAGLSALYARWSAIEAQTSRRQSKSEILSPLFHDVRDVITYASTRNGFSPNDINQNKRPSIDKLKIALPNDEKLIYSLNSIDGWLSSQQHLDKEINEFEEMLQEN